ncbi:MAG TPA: hypothetical protein GX707_12755, partial [Epulopiscium sp.]|nr:hypothetical protein [Candidatus Epulonipiscium sp.]
MPIDYDYYFKIKQNYTDLTDKNGLVKDIQDMANKDLQSNMITEFDMKIGMDFYRETVLVNFERELDCIIKFKRMKEAVYNSSARELMCEA